MNTKFVLEWKLHPCTCLSLPFGLSICCFPLLFFFLCLYSVWSNPIQSLLRLLVLIYLSGFFCVYNNTLHLQPHYLETFREKMESKHQVRSSSSSSSSYFVAPSPGIFGSLFGPSPRVLPASKILWFCKMEEVWVRFALSRAWFSILFGVLNLPHCRYLLWISCHFHTS